jgi:multiple antibiotic resistance protein
MDFGFLFYAFITIFLIVDPVASIPLFGSLLEGKKKKEKKRMVRQALAIACVVLAILAPLGKRFFDLMGVSMYSFKVAGGILLFIISLEMLFGKHTRTEYSAEEHAEAKEIDDIVITPMAIPLLTGPGAITTSIVLFESAASAEQKALVLVAILLAFLASWILLEFSDQLFEWMGPVAVKVVVRVMGLVLTAIAVQFVFTGIGEAMRALSVA